MKIYIVIDEHFWQDDSTQDLVTWRMTEIDGNAEAARLQATYDAFKVMMVDWYNEHPQRSSWGAWDNERRAAVEEAGTRAGYKASPYYDPRDAGWNSHYSVCEVDDGLDA